MEMEFAYQGTIVGPPTDDVCPICFDEFTAPCMTSCRHWFCADCILKYWYYRGGVKKCKCPKCNGDIHKLKVEASLFVQDDEQNVKILEKVMHYNRLYAGGWHFFSMVRFLATLQLQKKSKRYPGLSNDGCWQKVLYFMFAVWYLLLLITQRILRRLMNPDLYLRNSNILRLIAFLLATLYLESGFDFIPTGNLTVLQLFDYVAIGVTTILTLVGLIRRF